MEPPRTIDLGRCSYTDAYEAQCAHHEEVLAARQAGKPEVGRILTVEHTPPVITVSRRPGANDNLLASAERLAARGIEVCATDRGGDITYHGPGQLVVYPIIDLATIGVRLHDYLRLLETVVIESCTDRGLQAERDDCATGAWIRQKGAGQTAKICAIGVRVRRWVTMHGLALNVTTDLSHFDLIVPCGLHGRAVTSLERELPTGCPSVDEVRADVVTRLIEHLGRHADHAPAITKGYPPA